MYKHDTHVHSGTDSILETKGVTYQDHRLYVKTDGVTRGHRLVWNTGFEA